jgi:hypothetical protein
MERRHLNTLHYHFERLLNAGPDQEHHWTKVAICTDELLAQPSAQDQQTLRRLLLQFREDVAQRTLPQNYVLLLREIERAAHKGMSPGESAPASAVEEVAALLRGRALLVIGGTPRPEHADRLQRAFELGELVWPETSEHNPNIAVLEPYVARPEVAVVLLLIRWIRHAMNEIAGVCTRHGKPLVRVPGGYNPEQIAPLILAQSGRRLSGSGS